MAVVHPIILYGVIFLTFLLFAKFLISRRSLCKFAARLPGPPHLPVIGNALLFYKDTWEGVLKSVKYTNNDGLVKVWFGSILMIGVSNPESAKYILNNALQKDENIFKFFRSFLGNGLLSSPVPLWKPHRKLILPAFNPKKLNAFVEIFAKHSDILVKKLSKKAGREEFDICQFTMISFLDMVCETMMGEDVNSLSGKKIDVLNAIESGIEIITLRSTKIWLRFETIFNLTKYQDIQQNNINVLNKFVTDVIDKKLAALKINQNLYSDDFDEQKTFVDMLIELVKNKHYPNLQSIKDEIISAMFAGNDTSAFSSSYIFLVLGQYSHIQNKIVEELNSIFGNSMRPITKEDLPNMKYLERVILETLRLFPIVPLIYRRIDQDMQIGNYTFPTGCICAILIYEMQRDKKQWGDDADEFNPDRFLPENSQGRHPYSFLTFSGGIRNCIGKQYGMNLLKTLIATVLRSYKIHTTLDTNKMPLEMGVFLKPKSGFMVSIKSRISE